MRIPSDAILSDLFVKFAVHDEQPSLSGRRTITTPRWIGTVRLDRLVGPRRMEGGECVTAYYLGKTAP